MTSIDNLSSINAMNRKVILVCECKFKGYTYDSDEVRTAGVAESVRDEDLDRFGGGPPGGHYHVEKDVGDDGPVEVKGDLAEEEEDERHVDVLVRGKHSESEQYSGQQKSDAADDWIGARILLLQLGAQDRAQGHAHNSREHRHEAENQGNTEMQIRFVEG